MGMKATILTSGPIGFTDSSGKQLSIPGSAIHFDDAGAVKADQWPLYGANKTIIDAWLPYLAQHRAILPAPTTPSAPAMVIRATNPGSSGNNIQVTFSNPSATTFDAKVTETDTYPLLMPATIKGILGTSSTTGTQPGLVYVSSQGDPSLPKAGDYLLQGNQVTADIAKNAGDGTAFTVKARSVGLGDTFKVTIKEVVDTDTAQTFTLVATWTKAVQGIQAQALQTNFAGEITVEPPTPGGTLAVPAAVTIPLSGGADAKNPVQASATVTANS